jgi:hypothetical protein
MMEDKLVQVCPLASMIQVKKIKDLALNLFISVSYKRRRQ